MKIKEAFEKLETYNELAEMMGGDKMHIYFADTTSRVSFGDRFDTYTEFRKHVREEYFKEVADRILKADCWKLNEEIILDGFAGRFSEKVYKYELDLSYN